MSIKVKDFLYKKRKRIAVLSYFIIYLVCFYIIEHVLVNRHFFILDTPFDHMIPFIPQFVIAYYLWFFYHVWGLLPAFLHDDGDEYYRIAFALFSGMTIFIIVSIVFPNAQGLRPSSLRNDVFSKMVGAIYAADTPTNVMPSIHVYNSLVICAAIERSKEARNSRLNRIAAPVIAILIILSTVFIKQHTILDIIGAFIMFSVLYPVFFKWVRIPAWLD